MMAVVVTVTAPSLAAISASATLASVQARLTVALKTATPVTTQGR
jgi:hypothetical protein